MKELKGKLTKMPVDTRRKLNAVAKEAANNWARLAKRAAPVDKGPLGQRITTPGGNGRYEVVSSVLYAPYNEWGTVTKVSVPVDLRQYAIKFKGKGIIKTGGMKPKPWFFIHRPVVEKQFLADVKKITETEL